MTTEINRKKFPVKEMLASLTGGIHRAESNHPLLELVGLPDAPCYSYEGDTEFLSLDLHRCIIVKILDIEREFVNALIKVSADGKTFEDILIPGGKITGCFARIGKPMKTILVVEDYFCGMALYLATGMSVAVANYSSNILHVCKALRKKYPEKKLIVCGGDHGNTQDQRNVDTVNAVARKLGIPVAFPNGESNFLEHYRKNGSEAVAELIYDAKPPEELFPFSRINGDSGVPEEPRDWSNPVNGESLLADLVELLDRYMSLPEGAAIAIALWIFFTHTIEVARVAPILLVRSPVRQCGKTTLLGLLKRLTFRATPSSSLTPAVLFRTVDKFAPTLIVDEADTFLVTSPELTGIVNSGHTRETAFVQRMGPSGMVLTFKTFCAKVIAMIGSPAETITDRAIIVNQQRKLESEEKANLPKGKVVEIEAIRARIARWSRDNLQRIEDVEFDRPKLGSDRAADNWEPLLAIAKTLGETCFSEAIESATLLSQKHALIRCTGEELLRDIKAVFDKTKAKALPTMLLISELCADIESLWLSYNHGKAVTPTELARLLKTFDIESANLRVSSDSVVKGYKREDFDDAFARYVPAKRQ